MFNIFPQKSQVPLQTECLNSEMLRDTFIFRLKVPCSGVQHQASNDGECHCVFVNGTYPLGPLPLKARLSSKALIARLSCRGPGRPAYLGKRGAISLQRYGSRNIILKYSKQMRSVHRKQPDCADGQSLPSVSAPNPER